MCTTETNNKEAQQASDTIKNKETSSLDEADAKTRSVCDKMAKSSKSTPDKQNQLVWSVTDRLPAHQLYCERSEPCNCAAGYAGCRKK